METQQITKKQISTSIIGIFFLMCIVYGVGKEIGHWIVIFTKN